MAPPKLSICIPTYNRRTYLSEAINSIIEQIDPTNASLIEICISDNASTDGTDKLVKEIQEKTPAKIIYSRVENNAGPDANYLRAVALASGEYCWFLGSDDHVLLGGVNFIMREIANGHDIYLCNRIDCDATMEPLQNRYWLERSVTDKCFDFSNPAHFVEYSRLATTLGAFFSYLSSIVFKRKKWTKIQFDPIFIGSAYSHVYMLLSFIESGCILQYISAQLVKSRGGNDGFLEPGAAGQIKRVMLDINGYTLLAKKLFENLPIYRNALIHVLHVERPALRTLADLRYQSNPSEWRKIAEKCMDAGYPSTLLRVITISKPLIYFLKKTKAFTNKFSCK